MSVSSSHPDQPEWLSHVNASVLKVKLATAAAVDRIMPQGRARASSPEGKHGNGLPGELR
jgi:hypothetical protein